MTATPTWPAMTGFSDGQNVDAATLNAPIQQLASRTELLWRLLAQNDRTKVAIDVEISGATPAVGQPVYRVGADGTFAKAIGAVGNNEWFYADSRAMAVGVVSAISGPTATTATVVLCGYLALGSGVDVGDLIDDPSPVSGRYYLSNYNAGKLTANPSGPVIYVCDCYIDGGKVKSMLVNPQYRDTGESHVHRSFVLSGMPEGGYAVPVSGKYRSRGINPGSNVPSSDGSEPEWLRVTVGGVWKSPGSTKYTLTLGKTDGTYTISYTSDNDGSGSFPLDDSNHFVGTHGAFVKFLRGSPATDAALDAQIATTGKPKCTWELTMPDAGRDWLDNGGDGFALNLGMYAEIARYVPPLPANGAALTADGIELRGPVYTDTELQQWYIADADTREVVPASGGTAVEAPAGPWLMWKENNFVAEGVTLTAPFGWTANDVMASPRNIVFNVNRMRVGPTGFVTSLQAAPGSPIRITSAQTDAVAKQGALQIGLDINFKSSAGNVAGSQVVKRINGSTFETGPVVERIIAGPGMAVSQEQGIVRVSASNAVYAGDFETIALKNAKQDLAGGVFPYTKLIGPDITSGFTAKFRVPDHIPYGKYNVIVSASVFGEAAVPSTASQAAAFSLLNYILPDQACSSSVDPEEVFNGSISSPIKGYRGDSAKIAVAFPAGYVAYNPVLLHGFSTDSGAVALANIEGQRKSEPLMRLKDEHNKAIEVYPGYFVGIEIQRCAPGGTLTPYTNPIGFLSLRWNLVEV